MKLDFYNDQITDIQKRLALLSQRVDQSSLQDSRGLKELVSSTRQELIAFLTQIKEINEQLHENYGGVESERQRYKTLFDFAPAGYLVSSQDGVILEANQTAVSLFRTSKDRLVGMSLADFVVEIERPAFLIGLEKIASRDKTQDWEINIHPFKGATFPASLNVASIPDETGNTGTLLWLVRNITRRKTGEAALQKKTAQVKLLQEIGFSVNEAITLESALQLAIDRICAFAGWPIGHVYLRSSESPSTLVSTDIWHLDPPEKYQAFRTLSEHISATSSESGLPLRVVVDGEPLWVSDLKNEPSFTRRMNTGEYPVRSGMFFPILVGKEIAGVLEFFSEERIKPDQALLDLVSQIGTQVGRVVERKQAEEKIHEQEELIHSAISVASMVFFILDCQGMIRLSSGNQRVNFLKNYDLEGQSLYKLAKNQTVIIEGYERALSGGISHLVLENNDTFFEVYFSSLQNSKGEITGVVGVASDITSRKQVEEALRKSEKLFRTIFEEAGLAIDLVDLDGRLIEFNPAFEAMMGYSAEGLHNMTFSDLSHPDDVEQNARLFEELIAGVRDRYQIEKRYIRKDGEIVWARVAITSVRNKMGEPQYAIAMLENITSQKQMEAEMAELERRLMDRGETERLQLAQELHDGPLQDLHSAIYQLNPLQDWIQAEEGLLQLKGTQNTLYQIIDRVRDICGELRPPALAPFGLEKAIRSHAGQIQELHPELQIALDLVTDRQSLSERVRLALFRIYQHAIANIIRHSNAGHILVHFDMDAEQIVLDIQDDGQGFKIPARWIELVRQGHFGLVGSAERAAALGGYLQIESQPGQGTAVRVVIPRQEERQASRADRLPIKIKK